MQKCLQKVKLLRRKEFKNFWQERVEKNSQNIDMVCK